MRTPISPHSRDATRCWHCCSAAVAQNLPEGKSPDPRSEQRQMQGRAAGDEDRVASEIDMGG